jgi:hypothetical protein
MRSARELLVAEMPPCERCTAVLVEETRTFLLQEIPFRRRAHEVRSGADRRSGSERQGLAPRPQCTRASTKLPIRTLRLLGVPWKCSSLRASAESDSPSWKRSPLSVTAYTSRISTDAVADVPGRLENVSGSVAKISDPAAVDALFEDVAENLGGLDVLVKNAGIAGPTRSLPPESFSPTSGATSRSSRSTGSVRSSSMLCRTGRRSTCQGMAPSPCIDVRRLRASSSSMSSFPSRRLWERDHSRPVTPTRRTSR